MTTTPASRIAARDAVIDAAQQLLVLEEGDEDAVSLGAVAEAAGVPLATVLALFADHEALFWAVSVEQFRRIDRLLETAIAGVDDPVEALRAVGRAYARFGLEQPDHYRVLFGTNRPAVLPPGEEPGVQAIQRVAALVRRGIAEGRFRLVDPPLAATALWTALHGAISIQPTGPSSFPWPERAALVEAVLDMTLRGLAP